MGCAAGWLGSHALPSLVRSFVETGKDGTQPAERHLARAGTRHEFREPPKHSTAVSSTVPSLSAFLVSFFPDAAGDVIAMSCAVLNTAYLKVMFVSLLCPLLLLLSLLLPRPPVSSFLMNGDHSPGTLGALESSYLGLNPRSTASRCLTLDRLLNTSQSQFLQ